MTAPRFWPRFRGRVSSGISERRVSVPIRLTVDHDARAVYSEAEGSISRADIDTHVSAEAAAGGIPYPELIDATRATPSFTGPEARALVEQIRVLASRTR